jgi:hypothetical protein
MSTELVGKGYGQVRSDLFDARLLRANVLAVRGEHARATHDAIAVARQEGWQLGLIRLWIGELAGWRKLSGELLDRFGRKNDSNRANDVAWACSLGPGGAANPQATVRLAEAALRYRPSNSNILNKLRDARRKIQLGSHSSRFRCFDQHE